jgi:hypothetical protein
MQSGFFYALFKGVSTRFGLLNVEKCLENPDCSFCSSFQHLRLGSINVCSAFQHLRLGEVKFQWLVAQNRDFHISFILPKSSCIVALRVSDSDFERRVCQIAFSQNDSRQFRLYTMECSMTPTMTTVATAQASSEWSECYHEQSCNGNRNIWDEMADFEESYYNLTETPNEEFLYRLLRFVDDHMPLRIGSDLCLRHVRDESVRCLASSYMRDSTPLPFLLQKVKEIDPSLETRSD